MHLRPIAKVLNYLWNLGSPPTSIDVFVSGVQQFNLENLATKDVARKLRRLTNKTHGKR
jgi:hypothetical protein